MQHLFATARPLCIPCAPGKLSFFKAADQDETRFLGPGGHHKPLHRLYSYMRLARARTLVREEEFAPFGPLEKDDAAFARRLEKGRLRSSIVRLSFFKTEFDRPEDIRHMSKEDYLGYAILRGIPSEHLLQIWEAVVTHTPILNNYLHTANLYEGYVGREKDGLAFPVSASYYAQQNGYTSVCAHVALQTVLNDKLFGHGLTELVRAEDLNEFWGVDHSSRRLGAIGGGEYSTVSTIEVQNLLRDRYKQSVHACDFNKPATEIDYSAFLYPYIESDCPCLLTFGLAQPEKPRPMYHVVPVTGHTFNSDLWFPEAGLAYLRIPDEKNVVLDSRQWVDHFLIHDDNYGMYMCLPAHCLDAESRGQAEQKHRALRAGVQETSANEKTPKGPSVAQYAFAVVPAGIALSPQSARRWAARILYDLKLAIDRPVSTWLNEVFMAWDRTRPLNRAPVVRTVLVTRDQLHAHWKDIGVYNGIEGNAAWIRKHLPAFAWLVEVSISEIFTVNRSKILDVVLDATHTDIAQVCNAIRTPCRIILPRTSKEVPLPEDLGYRPVFRHARTPPVPER